MAKEKESPKKLSRREFVKGAAAVAGAGALVSCAPAATPAPAPTCPPVAGVPDTWDKEADVVVVGFGGAGGSAALEAHDAGAEVIILEKTPTPGGATSVCGGIIYAAGSSVQKAAGITDTPDEMYEYWMAAGKGLNDPELDRILADRSAEMVEWLIEMGGVFKPERLYFSGAEADPEFAAITPPKLRGHYIEAVTPTWPFPPESDPTRTYGPTAGGTGFFSLFWEGANARGIEVLLETPATALVTDPITKEVLGVKAESQGNTLYIKARGAVVLAAGTFGMNKEMCKLYCPDAVGSNWNPLSHTGDGIKMAMAIGAELRNMNQSSIAVSIPQGSIMVNHGGRRFFDETCYRTPGEAAAGYYVSVHAIFDDAIQQEAQVAETIQAPTIGELAVEIGLAPSVLEDTVDTYNGYAKSGKDLEFGRTTKGPHGSLASLDVPMVPIETPPFHAVKVSKPVTSSVMIGGLRINTKAQVIDVYGEVIPRLYAAGRTAAGSMGEMYPGSGSSILDVFTFGRIAGKDAAAQEPWG